MITGGSPAGLVTSNSLTLMFSHTPLAEQVSWPTFLPLTPLLVPWIFMNLISVTSTLEGYCAQYVCDIAVSEVQKVLEEVDLQNLEESSKYREQADSPH